MGRGEREKDGEEEGERGRETETRKNQEGEERPWSMREVERRIKREAETETHSLTVWGETEQAKGTKRGTDGTERGAEKSR